MAHLVYALCGHGRGHSSRARAVAATLVGRGHRVTFAADAPAADRFEADGLGVRRVPGLRQVLRRNRVRLVATARENLDLTWRSPEIIAEAAAWLGEAGADLVITDHEPFFARAAPRAGVPVVALSHQLILTETRPAVPLRHRLSALGTALGIGVLAPSAPAAAIVPSFFFPPLRRGSTATLVPPILRDDVLALRPSCGGRMLVYVNEGDGMEAMLAALAGVPADVYGLGEGPAPLGVRRKAPSREGFLRDLAAARAVVATAGFTLLSEALHLGKPVLALPNRGFFEQAVNAHAIVALGRGEAVERDLRAADVQGFLDRADAYSRPPGADGIAGREQAADAVERVLGRGRQRLAA
ncbi:glycosyltransferase family protein [Rubrivirga sp. IMCC45206]|uniref:glycosyltransferase family protein n=1 Tax=Rubrivirga sp. IMCC45206 TaxID=3391614 RepID=UPI00398FCF84